MAASGLRDLGDESAYGTCLERLSASVLVPLEEGERETAARHLQEAEHLLRSFDATSGPRTMLGGSCWGLDPASPYVGWKPGASDPFETELRFALRMSPPGALSEDQIEARALALGGG
jgi:hypothetical protein